MRHLALFLSFCVGFLSLSQEIVWVRLVSFSQHGSPHAFPLVLAPFLIGIAFGAIVGRQLCEKSAHLLRAAAWVLLAASAIDFALLYLMPSFMASLEGSPRRLLILMALIALTAGLKGVLFPIVHHLGSDATVGRVGRSVSRIYFGNVIGSTLGPIVTGFWLFDNFKVETTYAVIGALTATVGGIALAGTVPRPKAALLIPLALLVFGILSALHEPNIILASAHSSRIRHIIQNKHGIIHVIAQDLKESTRKGDVTFGGNIYDGRINVDMAVNSNLLDRAYLMAVMHPAPRRVLVVGMSTGAWVRVITGLPGIQHVDIVEINPGYLELVRAYPEVSPILDDPRVHIHIDDGRRWLRAHPEERYDLVFQNTTFHWRAYATMLLSKEYMREIKTHLKPGGIVATNTTGSLDVYRTALEVFPHAVRYLNFVYMSDRPLSKRADSEQVLRQCKIGERPAFCDALFKEGGIGTKLAHERLESAQEHLAAAKLTDPPRAISDLNLITEFRHGRPSPLPWLQPLLPPSPNRE